MSSLSGKIQTVLGPIEPGDLGTTLTHEHLSMTFDVCFVPVTKQQDKHLEQVPLVMHNLGWIRQNPYSHLPNLHLNDEHEAVTEEIKYFKSLGGQAIVENTSIGIHRDVEFLRNLSKETKVNIIAGTGYYINESHPSDMSARTVESLSADILRDINVGADGTDVKCGIIGEIGCCWPLHQNERKVLQAAAHAQTESGCPVMIHPGRHPDAPEEALRILQEAGGDVTKTVMAHLDRTIFDYEALVKFAEIGSFCEWDLFGVETSHYMYDVGTDMPSDAQRVAAIKWLSQAGFDDRIVVGHDIHTKHRLTKYGGHGYSHILVNIVPKMLARGITQEVINKILVDNPRRWLTFK